LVEFKSDPTVRLIVILGIVKLDNRYNYARIRIFLFNSFLDHIISSLFKMIRPRITNRYNECFISLRNSFLANTHLQQLCLKVHDLIIRLRVILDSIKLDSKCNYARIQIFLFNSFLDRSISSLFKMIRPHITNRYNGYFISLLFKYLKLFSCHHSPPTTLFESSNHYLLPFILSVLLHLFL